LLCLSAQSWHCRVGRTWLDARLRFGQPGRDFVVVFLDDRLAEVNRTQAHSWTDGALLLQSDFGLFALIAFLLSSSLLQVGKETLALADR